MTGYSDETKMVELLAPLSRLEPAPFAVSERRPRRIRRPLLVAVILTAGLALTGVAIANSLGAFNGIGAAQRSQNGSDVLDSRVTGFCSVSPPATYEPLCHLVPNSVRLISTLASGRKVYVVADTRGDLCVVDEDGTIVTSCGPPLSRSHPVTGTFANDSPTTGGEFVAGGVAMNGIISVSFTPSPGDGKGVTVPVKDNVWLYEQGDSHATDGSCFVAHLADGSSINPFSEVPCSKRRD